MIYKDVLSNGIRVLTEEIPYVHSVSLGIWVGSGSRNETKGVHGVSHFIEHMLFKGTKTRTAKQIAESLDMVGGNLNAFTSKEHTCYYARVLSEDFDMASDILADMILNSSFAEEEMDKERNVILEEIKMYEDTPDDLVHDILTQAVWKNNFLGEPIIGTADSVANLSREQMMEYYQNLYVPENMVIAVAGNINREQVVKRMEALFGGLSRPPYKFAETAPDTFSDIVFIKKDIEQVHLCLGIPGLPNQHEDIYSFHVLNNILGGGMSSRLFQKVREEQGLTYAIYSYHAAYAEAGICGVYAGTSVNNANQVMEIILKEIFDIKENSVTEEELQKTKQQIKGSILLSMENISQRMNRLGKSEILYNRIITPEEIVESIMEVTVDSVKKIARQVFVPEKFSLAVVGPKNPIKKIFETKI